MLTLPILTDRLWIGLPDATIENDVSDHIAFLSDLEVARMLATVPHPYDPADLPKRYASSIDNFRTQQGNFFFPIKDRVTMRLIGGVGLKRDSEGRELSPGYFIGRPFWGQGFASEALFATLKHALCAFPHVKKVEAAAYADNPASIRVMQKVGFTHQRTEQHACLARGPGAYPAKVLSLSKDSPLWSQTG